jgi:phosphoglucosamine mutase
MKRLFGTDGIRGRVDTGIFVPATLQRVGSAFGRWLIKEYGDGCTILMGYDTRSSAPMIFNALIEGLTQFPIAIHDAGIIPTPAAVLLMRKNPDICFSLIISASHNPASDNGIKCIDSRRGKLSEEIEQDIEHYFNSSSEIHRAMGSPGRVYTMDNAAAIYCTALQELACPRLATSKRIVVDMAHGATSYSAPALFRRYNIDLIELHNSPNGSNINENSGAVYPALLSQKVRETDADIGFGFDGDGDRIVAVNRAGEYKDGDDILCLLLQNPRYALNTIVVGTIMTNGGLEHQIRKQSMQLIRTAVGDRHIIQEMTQHKSTLGGEPAGHIILGDLLMTGDSMLTALVLLETLEHTHNWTMETFVKQPQVSLKIPIAQRYDLTQTPFKEIIESETKNLHNTRIVIRYSGTEPLLRIMAESESQHRAYAIAQSLAEKLAHTHKELIQSP